MAHAYPTCSTRGIHSSWGQAMYLLLFTLMLFSRTENEKLGLCPRDCSNHLFVLLLNGRKQRRAESRTRVPGHICTHQLQQQLQPHYSCTYSFVDIWKYLLMFTCFPAFHLKVQVYPGQQLQGLTVYRMGIKATVATIGMKNAVF